MKVVFLNDKLYQITNNSKIRFFTLSNSSFKMYDFFIYHPNDETLEEKIEFNEEFTFIVSFFSL